MELNQDLIMQFGLMQKLSTGNSMLDAILVMLLPLLFSRVLPYLQDAIQKWQHRTTRNMNKREITFAHRSNTYYDYDGDVPPNHKLQTAILVHINQLPDFQSKLDTADVKLVRVPKKKQEQQRRQQQEQQQQSVVQDLDSAASSCAESEDDFWYPDWELQNFEVNMVPQKDVWVTLEPGLMFCRREQQGTTGEGNNKTDETTVTFVLESRSVQQIDAFIAAAYDSYRAASKGQYENKGDEERYLYLPVLDAAKEGNFTFRAYPLTDGKDFTNFFHPEKEAILQLVEAFRKKTGKFAIRGYPQKLGFLLHGPPGTGKTSFIKALATHTKRSIINIPLSRIRTNQQLMSLMMDQQIRVEGDDYCRPLPHSKVIYVCEDVDAASNVVQKRGGVDPVALALSSLVWPAEPPGIAPAGRSAGQEKAATATQASVGAAEVAAAPNVVSVGRSRLRDSGDDALNLAGLLNVLDGVVDTPGRLLVLSSNHPEVLDPALIRPGRINRKVYMGRMACREALMMVCHYFGDVSPQQQEAFAAVWCEDAVSPAALESLCAECEDVDSLLKGVQVLMSHAVEGCAEEDGEQEEQGEHKEGKQAEGGQEAVAGAARGKLQEEDSKSPDIQAEGLQACEDDAQQLRDTTSAASCG